MIVTPIRNIIERRITPRNSQRRETGEVFTPLEFIENMLDHLPGAVWRNPHLRWLDPAAGIGNFPVVVFYRLVEGLAKWEPDEASRKKHIVENMLYMFEYQGGNARTARSIFRRLCGGCKPNILTVNSLTVTDERLVAAGFPTQYDIIVGNPPFNAGGLMKGGGAVWPKFVKLAFRLVAAGGYISFVHPPGWRKFYSPDERENQGQLLYEIRQRGWAIEYLNVSDKPPKHFPIVDYYVIKAGTSRAATAYESTFDGIVTRGRTAAIVATAPFIPNMLGDEVFSIIRKLLSAKGEPIRITYNQTVRSQGKGIRHYHYTDREGVRHFYNHEYEEDELPEYIRQRKVLMTFSGGYEKGRLFAFYSDDELGTTNNTMYMLVRSARAGNQVAKFLNSDTITFLMKITQYSASPNHKNEFKILNLLRMPPLGEDSYEFTKRENELIRRIVAG